MKYTRYQNFIHRQAQIYCQDNDGSGNPRYFYVAAMENWARANLEVERLKADKDYANGLIENGAIDLEHFVNHTLQSEFYPILICLEASKGGTLVIVDGNHRFVAFSLDLYPARKKIEQDKTAMQAYLLSPDQWKRFIVPNHEVAKLGLPSSRATI